MLITKLASGFAQGKRGLSLLLTLLLTMALPVAAFAGGEASVQLKFSQSDKIYLYISLGFGVLALVFGFIFRQSVMARSMGDEKMQEVGNAIKSGALAYLQQQVRTMGIFVVILAVGLYFMYQGSYGPAISAFVALSFVLGVAASYIAGYVGMLMAVNGNTRTAAGALTSYKAALETAFQSGAVAGLVTVGMGLLGATAIFLFAGENATKLLVGFGFGGSLAALFMRVGGGIYTKAADVGADLVGKVEAGIPEDDPRNPAVIADNVGDNVGDCAGMAADVFESYEVTLVAAIVLGAATAAIFDQETWMKLILFALMARGIGILASIIGIYMVKGSESLDSDPLKSIRRGFTSSAIIAGLATVGLAWFMMGGQNPKSVITTNQLVAAEEMQADEVTTIIAIQRDLAAKAKKKEYEIDAAEIIKDQRLEEFGLYRPDFKADQTDPALSTISQALTQKVETMPKVPDLAGYSKIDFEDANDPVLAFAAVESASEPTAEPKFVDFKTAYGKKELVVFEIDLTQTAPAPIGPDGKPQGTATTRTEKIYFGPIGKKEGEDQLKQANNANFKIEQKSVFPVTLYSNKQGDVRAVVDAANRKIPVHRVQGNGLFYFRETPEKVTELSKSQMAGQQVKFPQAATASVALVEHNTVAWYWFAICILFGIVMAFMFEQLTDYYVSLHKKPVTEIGSVATAGPAPMIITGFAYGKESSVFSLFAIVICLIVPLLVFPPAIYGSYLLSFYGIALVGLGLLTTTGFILAMDTFGPISDNAQGVFEMSGAGHSNPEGARRVQLLDAAGNTTKALTKGFAIATAVVAAVALFHAYVEEGMLTEIGMRLEVPEIFLGLLIGGAAPYLFSAFSINAVGRASFQLINEVRRQFRSDPGIMEGTSKPDYGKCVAIVTAAAQKELLGPGILAIAFPVLVAFGFAIGKPTTFINGVEYNLVGAQALGGFLAGTILSGQLMAVLLANSGGMWDNSKKLIEDGLHGGKGTEAHKAAVVCDTVGDPFKDTAGPALNPLIKVMNLVALLLAPQVIKPWSNTVLIAITVSAAIALVIAIWWSKRGSLGEGLQMAAAENASEAAAIAAPKPAAIEKPADEEKSDA